MKRFKTLISYTLYALLVVVTISSCTPLDTSLDGKILTDEDGKKYKLEWQDGWGATWAFKYPVQVITQEKDTIIEWRYYD